MAINNIYLNLLVSLALLIIPARDVLVSKNPKIYKRITWYGWVFIMAGFFNTYKTIAESKKLPLLNIFEGPRFLNRTADSIPIALSIKNFGDGTARSIGVKIVNVVRYGPFIKSNRNLGYTQNEELFLTAGGVYAYYLNFDVSKTDSISTTFIYFRISYADADFEPQKDTIRQIYPIPIAKTGVLIYDANPEDFDFIKSYLIQLKEW